MRLTPSFNRTRSRTCSRVFKRGMGVYQHCGEAHLHRYLAEFDFRYNRRSALGWTDAERVTELPRHGGKRLTYRRIGETKDAIANWLAKLARMRRRRLDSE